MAGIVTIRIEAELSTDQLLRAVEQLPPSEFAAFFVQLLERARREAQSASASPADDTTHGLTKGPAEQNPYLAAAGMFDDDSFAAEVDAYIAAQRRRERATHEAGA